MDTDKFSKKALTSHITPANVLPAVAMSSAVQLASSSGVAQPMSGVAQPSLADQSSGVAQPASGIAQPTSGVA